MLCCKIGTFHISYFVAYVVLQNLSQQMTSIFCPIFSGTTTSEHFGSSTPVFNVGTGAASAFGQPQQQAAGASGQPEQQAANSGAEPLGKKPLFSLLHILPTCRLSMRFSGSMTQKALRQWGLVCKPECRYACRPIRLEPQIK